MKHLIESLEKGVIHKYGFENPITINTFRFTEILRKLTKNF